VEAPDPEELDPLALEPDPPAVDPDWAVTVLLDEDSV
jgi:hypothetical protein